MRSPTMKTDTDPDRPELEAIRAEAAADPTGEGAPPAPAPEAAPAPTEAAPPAPAAKRGRGRPVGSTTKSHHKAKAPAPAEPAPIIDPRILRGLIQAPYAIAARQYGEHWALSDDEADAMVPAHLALAEKYLPKVAKENTALYTVLLLHGMMIVGRVQLQLAIRAEARELQAEREGRLAPVAPLRPAPKPKATAGTTVGFEPRPDASSDINDVLRPRVKPGPREDHTA